MKMEVKASEENSSKLTQRNVAASSQSLPTSLTASAPNATPANVDQTASKPGGLSQAAPSAFQGFKDFVITKLIPALFFIEQKCTQIYILVKPFALKLHSAIEAFLQKYVDPYGREEVLKALTGISMMFFGGFFITTIAVTEAILQGGADRLWKAINILREQTKILREANAKDDALDENNDGIADVKQISKQELAARKVYLYLKHSDPEVVSDALQSLYTVLVCVVATLRLKYARAISLGAAIGDSLFSPMQKYVVPRLKQVVDEDLHKWIRPTTRYICRFIGVSIALQLQRLLTTVHTAIRGARLLTDAVTSLSQKHGFSSLTDGYLDDLGAFGLAALGVYSQFFVFPYLPFLVQVLLFPATLVEWTLHLAVSASV